MVVGNDVKPYNAETKHCLSRRITRYHRVQKLSAERFKILRLYERERCPCHMMLSRHVTEHVTFIYLRIKSTSSLPLRSLSPLQGRRRQQVRNVTHLNRLIRNELHHLRPLLKMPISILYHWHLCRVPQLNSLIQKHQRATLRQTVLH